MGHLRIKRWPWVAMGGPVASWPGHSSRLAESRRLVRRMSHHVDPAAIAEEARTVRLDAVLGPPRRSVPVGDSSTVEQRTLTPLIMVRVEYPRLAVSCQSLLQRFDAKPAVDGVRQPPSQNRPAGPIDDRHEIQKAGRHRVIGDVGSPYVVRLGDRQAPQVGIYLVSRRGFARAWARNQSFDPHHAHQPPHPLPVDPPAFLVEFEHHPPRAVERQFEMEFVDPAHQGQIVPRDRYLLRAAEILTNPFRLARLRRFLSLYRPRLQDRQVTASTFA